MSDKKQPMSARERSAAASKRAKLSSWGKWRDGEFAKRTDPHVREWDFGGQKK